MFLNVETYAQPANHICGDSVVYRRGLPRLTLPAGKLEARAGRGKPRLYGKLIAQFREHTIVPTLTSVVQ